AVKSPGELTTHILDELLDDVVDVTDEEISQAITLLLERSKLVVEGAGAVGVAALLTGKIGGTGSVCSVLSGGNIDPTLLISVMQHALTAAGRYLVIRSRLPDRPGELIELLELIARERGNLVSGERGPDCRFRLGFDDVDHAVLVGQRPAQDEEAGVHEPVHEGRVLGPARLLLERPRRIPLRAGAGEHDEEGGHAPPQGVKAA